MDHSNHPNSKKVTIFRAGSFLSRAQGKEVDEYFSQSKVSVGSYYEKKDSRKIANGLTPYEENLLLPSYVDADPGEREFRKKVSEFYMDIDTKVPFRIGITLEIGLSEDNTKPVSEKNSPLETMDYLRYRHAIGHPFMAVSKEEAESNATKQYYIFDPTTVQSKNKKKNLEQDAAMQIYLSVKDKPEQVSMMLTLLGTDPREFFGPSADDLRIEALRKIAESKAMLFNKTHAESDLEKRYWVKTLVNTGVFKLLGERYVDAETKKIIGNNLEETIAYFTDEENSDAVVLYKSRMQEALKKPIAAIKRKTIMLDKDKKQFS